MHERISFSLVRCTAGQRTGCMGGIGRGDNKRLHFVSIFQRKANGENRCDMRRSGGAGRIRVANGGKRRTVCRFA